MNLADTMRSLIQRLSAEGINGETFPDISLDAVDAWGEDYCCAYGFRYYDSMGDSEYFDEAALMRDLRELVRETFGGDPTVVVRMEENFPYGSDTLEVYREITPGKFLRDEDGNHYVVLDYEKGVVSDGVTVLDLDRIDPWYRAYPAQMDPAVVERLNTAFYFLHDDGKPLRKSIGKKDPALFEEVRKKWEGETR